MVRIAGMFSAGIYVQITNCKEIKKTQHTGKTKETLSSSSLMASKVRRVKTKNF
jgi:hypothetical protein